MFGLHSLDLFTLLIYLVGVTFAGLWAARKITTVGDYFMGSRKFGKAFMLMHAFGTGTHTDHAVSVAGALGLMQIMPFWKDEIGRPEDNLIHQDTNLRYGCTILRFYLDKENGDLRRALGRYNGSLGQRKYPNKVIDKLTRKWYRA